MSPAVTTAAPASPVTTEETISLWELLFGDAPQCPAAGMRYNPETKEWTHARSDCEECVCGEVRHKNDICGHGYADGICCVCPECRAEMEDEEESDEE